MQVQVHEVHFEDFSGTQFERLGFAYLLRRPFYARVDWYGQLGKDRGRDIVCDHVDGSVHIYQCANYRRLTERKARQDLETLAKGPRSKDSGFHLIAGGGVSGALKDKVRALARSVGFSACETWSGPEFEERLRREAPDLLLRFTKGVPFPELRSELATFAVDPNIADEKAITFFKTEFWRDEIESIVFFASANGKQIRCVVSMEFLTAPFDYRLNENEAKEKFKAQRRKIEALIRQRINDSKFESPGEIILRA